MVGSDDGLVFVYSGQGGQFPGMAREVYLSDAWFRADMEQVDDAACRLLGRRFLPAMDGDGDGAFRDVVTAHPAVFAVQDAMSRLLARLGIRPDYVLGMSVGEFAGAVTSGAMSRQDALYCLLQQTRVLARIGRPGGMLAVVGRPELLEEMPLLEGNCEIVLTGLRHFVVAGDTAILEEAADQFRARAVPTWQLPVRCGFHSRLIDPARDAYLSAVSGRSGGLPQIPQVSCATGRPVDGPLRPDHLWRAVRLPIRFMEAAGWIASRGRYTYVDLGPGSMASSMLRQIGVDAGACYTLLGPQSDTRRVLDQLTRA